MARNRHPNKGREPSGPEQEPEMEMPEKIPFQLVVDAMLDENTPLQPRFVYRLSDLIREEVVKLESAWPRVPDWRRRALMEDIEEIGANDTLLSFEALSRLALEDSDDLVREIAVRTLWDYEAVDLIPVFLRMLVSDSATDVRAAAALALGKFVYLGEIEELDELRFHEIEDELLAVASGNDQALVRRRSLEALGFSSNPEVPPLIEKAYASGNNDWVASALFAMGRSANERWIPQVLAELENDFPDVRMEAARAAGELEISSAAPRLLELLEDEDDDVRATSIWSLSQIGGEGVREALEDLYDETEDDEEAELIEAALDNLDFTEEMGLFSLMDFPEADLESEIAGLDEELDEDEDEDNEDEEDLDD